MSVVTAYNVTGMTCGHCAHAVRQELLSLAGVESVDIALQPGAQSTVTVTSKQGLPLTDVSAAIDEAGYVLSGAA